MDSPRWLDPTEARTWRGYLRMHTMLDAELGRALARETGLSSADYEVLVHLSEAAGTPAHRLRMNDLGARMLWSKSRLSHQVTRMGQRGLVARQECPSDARGAFVCLTPAGLEAVRAAAPAHVESVRRHLFDLLSPEQVAVLGDVAEAVVGHLTGCPGDGRARPSSTPQPTPLPDPRR